VGIFDSASADQIRALAREAVFTRSPAGTDYDTACRYLAGQQYEDVAGLLRQRFPSSQSGEPGQEMVPFTINLTERYVSEAANVYDKGAKRKLVDENGEESEATKAVTEAMNRHADEIQLDETMCRVDQIQNLIESCALSFGQKRAKLSLRIVLPQHAALVKSDEQTFDDADQEDYRAYIVRLTELDNQARARFAWYARTETAIFRGMDAQKVDTIEGVYPNPWSWPQAVQTDPTKKAETQDRPLMPLVWWHRVEPIGELLSPGESSIVAANREINVALSVLMDTFRFQGFDTPVFNLADPNSPKAKRRVGARFPATLGIEETFSFAHSSAPYTEMVKTITDYLRMVAMCLRMSGNDFSIDAQAATSGFSKLVDALPKIEARAARVRRLRRMESEYLWPRMCAILQWLDVLPAGTEKLRLVTEFPDVEFPQTPEEIAKELETDIKYNLDTAANVYARRHGVSVEEAEEAVKKNAEKNRELRQAEQQAGGAQGPGQMFGQAPGQRPGQQVGQPGGPQQSRLGSLIRKQRSGNADAE
jgi:hypothetical protein